MAAQIAQAIKQESPTAFKMCEILSNGNLTKIALQIFDQLDEASLMKASLVDESWFHYLKVPLLEYVKFYNHGLIGDPRYVLQYSEWPRFMKDVVEKGQAVDVVMLILTLKELKNKEMTMPDSELNVSFDMFRRLLKMLVSRDSEKYLGNPKVT